MSDADTHPHEESTTQRREFAHVDEALRVDFDHTRLIRSEKLIRRRIRSRLGWVPTGVDYELMREIVLINEMDLAIATAIEHGLVDEVEEVLQRLEHRLREVQEQLSSEVGHAQSELVSPEWIEGPTASVWTAHALISAVRRPRQLPTVGRPACRPRRRKVSAPHGKPDRPDDPEPPLAPVAV
jgi:hypothetical protein